MDDCRFHLPGNQSGDSAGPPGKGANLSVVDLSFGEFREEGERCGCANGACRVSAPVGLADFLQLVGECNIRQGKVFPEQCFTFGIARIHKKRRKLPKLHPVTRDLCPKF